MTKRKSIRTERILQSVAQHELHDLQERVVDLIDIVEKEVLLCEAPLKDLEQNIIKAFPKTKKRQYATDTVRIAQLNVIPYKPSQSLLFKSVATNQGKSYTPEIFFEGIEFEEEDTPSNVTFVATDGEQYHITPIKFTENNAKVRCTCLDFHYRFAQYNAKAGDLYGATPPAYSRKTNTYPPVNPSNLPGVCKHLLKLMKTLEENKYVVAFSGTASTPTASFKKQTFTSPKGDDPMTGKEPGATPPSGDSAAPEQTPVDNQPSNQEQTSINDLTQQYQSTQQEYEQANDIDNPEQRKGMLDKVLPKLKQLYANIQQWGRKFPDWIKSKVK